MAILVATVMFFTRLFFTRLNPLGFEVAFRLPLQSDGEWSRYQQDDV